MLSWLPMSALHVVGVCFVLASWTAPALGADPASTSPGDVRFFKVAKSSFDAYTRAPTPTQRTWMKAHYWRMLTYSPYFDSRLAWFSDAWVYKDLYAIYTGSAPAHPEWILRDETGKALYIPYGCSGGTCPQYAADIGDPAFRANWIREASAALGKGYRGLFVDDVNMTISRVGDGTGHPVAPVDHRTGRVMTDADWRRYMAEFTEQIRAAFPKSEVVHNALWFVGHDDPATQRELRSADWINLERGVNDAGIKGGGGTYGFDTFLGYIDWLHGESKAVVFDAGASDDKGREYGLATYFAVSTGRDGLGNMPRSAPDDWWPAYDVSLGAPVGSRRPWNGVVRRDFQRGIVLVNAPGSAPQTLQLDGGYRDLGGEKRTSVVLGPAQGAVLTRMSDAPDR